MLSDVLCPADVPLALLPVRLETRFFRVDTAMELRIRVYPDKIHVDSHETLLTLAERDWGRHFWDQVWRAGRNADTEANAWRQLAERFGPERAAWIARRTRPTNLDRRPATPVAAGARLNPAPAFPDPASAPAGDDDAWRRAPRAQCLPDRWIAVAYHNGQVALTASSKPVVTPLAVGPDPSPTARVPQVGDDTLAIDDDMRWMVDFDAAEARGMALRMTLTPTQVAVGIQALFVFGVRAGPSAADGATELAALLDAHHHTDGLEFLRFGAATNNTAELRSAYASGEAALSRGHAIEIGAGAAASATARSNALTLGRALGLDPAVVPETLGRLAGGDSLDLDAASMNTVLWPVTWGYYLTNLIGFDGTGLSIELLTWARRHFIDHVRGSGPLPAIRCGRQPYGLLPVTSLDLWAPPPGEELAHAPMAWLQKTMLRLRDNLWRFALREVPRLGTPADPHEAMSRVMRTEALSSRYEIRSMLGRHYVQHLRAFLTEDLAASGWIATQDAAAAGILQRMNFPWRPRLARGAYGDLSHPLKAPLVQAGEVSATRRLEPDYIAALLAETTIDDIATKHVQDTAGGTLLHALLRHGLLLEYAAAAAGILSTTGTAMSTLLRDTELVDLVVGAGPTMTWRRQLVQGVPAITGTATIREFLQSPAGLQHAAAASLRDYRAALGRLQGRDSETLQYLMQTTLDLASHRMDAWATSFATQRLATMRATAATATGLRVGGYGWVEDLQSRGFGTPVGALPDEPAPLFAAPNDTGFIHAPSVMQASTAALLRNAHLGVDGAAETNAPLSIDLSSRRLRTARWLLDGVRRGQPVGALLGYRFERRLHDDRLDVEIARFRRIAPLVADKMTASALPAESIAAGNVVDGLRLAQWWEANRTGPQGTAFNAKLKAALDELNETVDAVGDALTAEAAHQMVRGNTTRIAGSLAALTQGDGAVPELDVARTPRTGTLLTHRVVLLFAGAPAPAPGWPAASASQRATAEPMLDAWAGRMLGDPTKVHCLVDVMGEGERRDTVVRTIDMPLAELKIAPLDVVHGVEASARPGQASALELRVIYQARRRSGGAGDTARVRLRDSRPAGAAPGDVFLADTIAQARALRRLFSGARALEGVDLDLPERAAAGTLDLANLENRVKRVEKTLADLLTAITTELARGAESTGAAMRALMLRADGYGLPAAIPSTTRTDDADTRQVLRQQLLVLQGVITSRVQQTAARVAQRPAPADPLDSTQALRRHLGERLANVFGTDFVALPGFTCAHAAELASALGASAAVLDGDPLAVATWFERTKRVRDPVARLAVPLIGAEALRTGERQLLRVMQLPHAADARWIGLPATATRPIPSGRVSVVVQAAASLTPELLTTATTKLSGLMIDEWVEVVPNATETTAITFQTDPPNAMAPQVVLLAVPPVPGKPWTGETLVRVLFETLEQAKLRAIDAEALGELGHYLPALQFGFNVAGDVVSTDFGPLTRAPS